MRVTLRRERGGRRRTRRSSLRRRLSWSSQGARAPLSPPPFVLIGHAASLTPY